MSLVCGEGCMPRASSSARTAAKNSLGSAHTNFGHVYREFQCRWISVTHLFGGV